MRPVSIFWLGSGEKILMSPPFLDDVRILTSLIGRGRSSLLLCCFLLIGYMSLALHCKLFANRLPIELETVLKDAS